MSPLSNATTLANYASGIGTQGATLEIDSNNKRVGIGTTNPQGPEGSLQVGTAVTISGNSGIVSATTFHGDFGSSTSVAGDLTVSGVITYEDVTNIDSIGIMTARSDLSIADKIIHTGDTNTAIRFPAADTVTVETSGTERLRIDSSGTVKIGGSGQLALDISYDGSGSTAAKIVTNTGVTNANSTLTFAVNENSGAQLQLKGDGAAVFSEGSTERLRIDSSGQVIIGATSATGLFSVHQATSSTSNYINITNDATGTSSWANGMLIGVNDVGDALVWQNESRSLRFGTGNVDKMRLDSSGRLLLGTTTASGYTDRLLTVGDASTSNITAEIRSSSQGQISFSDGVAQDASSYRGLVGYNHGSDYMYLYTNSAERLRITSSGDVGIGNQNPVSSGGYRTLTIGDGSSTGGQLHLENSSGGNFSIWHATTGVNYYASTAVPQIFHTNASERMRIDSSGRLLIGTTTEGYSDADDLTVASSGNAGITIRSGTTNNGAIYFSNGTSGNSEYRGYIEYNQNSGFLRFGSGAAERLRISSDGNVQISMGGSGYATLFRYGTNEDNYIRSGANGFTAFGDHNGGERMRIDSSGRLLIGNTSSTSNIAGYGNGGIQLNSTTTAQACVNIIHRNNSANTHAIVLAKARDGASNGGRVQNNDDFGAISFQGFDGTGGATYRQGAEIRGAVDGTPGNADMPGRLEFLTSPDGSATPTERMRINSSGNVGINNTSPGNYASDGRNLVVGSGSGTNGLTIASGSSNSGNIYFADGTSGSSLYTGTITYYHASNYMGFWTDAQERMRLSSNGNLTINSTNVLGVGILSFPFYGQTQNGLVIKSTWNGNNASYVVIRNHSDTTIGSITATTSATSYNTSSDYRLKENVVDIADGITRVKQLQPKRFNFIADADTTVDGFLAHEAQTVVPEAVTGTHNEVEVWQETDELPEGVSVGDNKLDDEGNTIPVMQGIDHAKLVPLLTAALQEAIAEIESLKARVTVLEG